MLLPAHEALDEAPQNLGGSRISRHVLHDIWSSHKTRHTRDGSRLALAAATILTLAATTTVVGAPATSDSPASTRPGPTLLGRAVLPASTIAGPPVSGQFMPPGNVNGITFPLAGQPVAGFSAIVEGRRRGEYLAMTDNGFGPRPTRPTS